MANVSGNLNFGFNLTEAVSSGLVSQQNLPASYAQNLVYTNGTGALQLDTIYAKQLTLAASTPQTLDFTSVNDLSGASVTFARIREFVVVVQDATASHVVTIGGGASNPWLPVGAGLLACPNGSPLRISDPNSTGAGVNNVVTSTSKTVKLDPGSNTVVVNVYAFGCSAA